MIDSINIGVLGATSPVGMQVLNQLTPLANVVAFSRSQIDHKTDSIRWVNLGAPSPALLLQDIGNIPLWIVAGPIWIIEEHFALMEQLGIARIVCLSSTSRFTKLESSSPYEEKVVANLEKGEAVLAEWASQANVGWTILRPTLIYGRGNDRNLSEIVKIIRKFRFFPLFGRANGLRQPIYVDDVAKACVQAAFSNQTINKAYNISGAEILTYKEMVSRVFNAMGLKPRLLKINLTLFNCALFFLKMIPRYKNWNANMVLRMNRDMVFSHEEACQDFKFNPQKFILKKIDVSE